MNTPTTLSRFCAQHCRRTTAPAKRSLTQQTRCISSTRRRPYAQHTDLPSEPLPQTSSLSEQSTSTAYTHRLRPTAFSRPELQNQPPSNYMYTGTITRTATMPETVQITRQVQIFDKFLQKHYTRPLRLKAHDPNPVGYLREGDVVEYGSYTQVEKDARLAKNARRVKAEIERLSAQDSTGKAVRRFLRSEEMKRKMSGEKKRGVQFVVRRVVTPFGVGLDERMERLKLGEGLVQERSREGGQDSLVRGFGGNVSRRSARASVAG